MATTWKKFKNIFFGERLFNFEQKKISINNKNFIIKQADGNNLEDCMNIQSAIYREDKWSRSNFFSELKSKNTLYLLVISENIPIALIGLSQRSSLESHITFVGVVPKWQHNGIGSYLLKLCSKISKTNNYLKLTLEVDANNYNAIKLYQRIGFKKINKKYRYYNNNHDAYELCKDLD